MTADAKGHPGAATHLGLVALHERQDIAAAEIAYLRGAERGDSNGAFHLGLIREARGDAEGAEQAFAQADALGHGGAAANLASRCTSGANSTRPRRPSCGPTRAAMAGARSTSA